MSSAPGPGQTYVKKQIYVKYILGEKRVLLWMITCDLLYKKEDLEYTNAQLTQGWREVCKKKDSIILRIKYNGSF